jgi:hypothetical protein
VDGTKAVDADLSHAPAEHQALGLHEISEALSRRRQNYMAADVSSSLNAVADRLAGISLAGVTARRRQLERSLAAAPADPTRSVDQARRAIETIRSRRQAWTAVLSDTGPDHWEVRRARSALAALDHAEQHTRARLLRALSQRDRRDQWLREHAELVADYEIVRRAERVRETQIRVDAVASHGHVERELFGPEPSSQRERLAWRRAVEAIAVYRARYPHPQDVEQQRGQAILGPRPTDQKALADYVRTNALIGNARRTTDDRVQQRSAELGIER